MRLNCFEKVYISILYVCLRENCLRMYFVNSSKNKHMLINTKKRDIIRTQFHFSFLVACPEKNGITCLKTVNKQQIPDNSFLCKYLFTDVYIVMCLKI